MCPGDLKHAPEGLSFQVDMTSPAGDWRVFQDNGCRGAYVGELAEVVAARAAATLLRYIATSEYWLELAKQQCDSPGAARFG
jgi:hypothetical protein